MALADETRLRLLNLMRESEVCVCFLVEVLGESQPKISRHLAYLRNAGIIEARRNGKWIHYKIIKSPDAYAAQVLRDTLLWLDSQEEMRAEYKKLANLFRSFDRSLNIERAPQSNIFASTNINCNQTEELEVFLL